MKSSHKQILYDAYELSKSHTTDLKTNYSLCAIIKIGKNKYIGYNRKKTHPLQKEFGKNSHSIYLHAEIDAIRQAYRVEGYLGEANLYIARSRSDGSIATAMPCKGCQKAIQHFNISNIYFTTENGYGKL